LTKRYIAAGLAAALLGGVLIGSAPPASAGCQYGGYDTVSSCDDPVQPDGTWQRCNVYYDYLSTGSSHIQQTMHRCYLMGPGQNVPWGIIFNIPPTHIDD
jgi:hypothetical protein